MASSHGLEQFIAFTTDSVGLERILRFCQATVMILLSYTPALHVLCRIFYARNGKKRSSVMVKGILLGVNQHMSQARRYFRIFRFLPAFFAARKLLTKISNSQSQGQLNVASLQRVKEWIEVFGLNFNGLWFLLDATLVVDALEMNGLQLWGPELQQGVHIEAQRFWFFGLLCGVLAGLIEIYNLVRSTYTLKEGISRGSDGVTTEAPQSVPEGIVKHKQENMSIRGAGAIPGPGVIGSDVQTRLRGLARTTIANAVDMILPGAIVGWVRIHPGLIGFAMLTTTILTSIDVWQRCGREVLARSKQAA
ncbi:hypothetical protein SUNI508_04519 [Seiridium unicorne]|uniref:Uncharacterized protein n=1 Tax=Seiridium unicorne TaxID=138068 RepID=A0ABR2V7G7_9PEZI